MLRLLENIPFSKCVRLTPHVIFFASFANLQVLFWMASGKGFDRIELLVRMYGCHFDRPLPIFLIWTLFCSNTTTAWSFVIKIYKVTCYQGKQNYGNG